MDIGCRNWMEKIRPKMPEHLGRILDIGSLNINGSAREYFQKDSSEYIGIDMLSGKDVDIVINGHDLKSQFPELESFDTIICMNTFEHDNKFWLTLDNINYLLKKGGYFIFASPTYDFPVHNHPSDYYRFLESSVREVILEGYTVLDITEVASRIVDGKGVNHIICGLGQKI